MRTSIKAWLAVGVLASAMGVGVALAQPAASAPAKVDPAREEIAPKAIAPADAAGFKLADVAYIAGSWSGEVRGALVEETWTRPFGANMTGMFRWVDMKSGTPSVIELLTISQEGQQVRMRLRHHDAALKAREATDKPLTLLLTKLENKTAVFTAEKDAGDVEEITYRLVQEELLMIRVAFKEKEGGVRKRSDLVFELKKPQETR